MTTAPALPGWAEEALRLNGPQPAFGAAAADPGSMTKYNAITARFRRRWAAELAPDLWSLFGADGEHIEHRRQAMLLFGWMIDMARYGSHAELDAKRRALADVGRYEDEIQKLAEAVRVAIQARAFVTLERGIEGGMDDDLLAELDRAAEGVAMQSWREPRLDNSDFTEAIRLRTTTASAVDMMLVSIQRIEPYIRPVVLPNEALATIVTVSHDMAEPYLATAIANRKTKLGRR